MFVPINYRCELDGDEDFWNTIKKLSEEVEEIIETGTFLGNGSTRVFASTGKPLKTIECNKNNYEIAKKNLEEYKNVEVLHGFSLKKQEMIDFILSDEIYSKPPKEIIMIDGDGRNSYLKEINQDCENEDLLWQLINNEKKQLIFLDSAGGVGFLEFQKVMSLPEEYKKNKILVLDDLPHIKHFRSKKKLIEEGYKLNISKDGRWGWVRLWEK